MVVDIWFTCTAPKCVTNNGLTKTAKHLGKGIVNRRACIVNLRRLFSIADLTGVEHS